MKIEYNVSTSTRPLFIIGRKRMLNYINNTRRYRTKGQKAFRITNLTPKAIGYNMGLIFDAIDKVPETKNIICMAHYEEYKDKNGDSISYKYKTTGNMVDAYITPEGKFEIVLFGKIYVDENTKKVEHVLVTNNDGEYPAKSPVGMLPETYMPNDLGIIVKKIEEYYN